MSEITYERHYFRRHTCSRTRQRSTRSRTSRPGKTAHSAAGCEKIIVGTILGVLNSSEALVDHRYNASGAPLKARTVAFLSEDDLGRQAVLGFEEGDVSLPIILGTIKTTLGTIKTTETEPKHATVEAAPDRLVLTADREIVLRCGEASITLTRAGKVLIRGEYILSRSSGTNCIKGGSVRIN